MRRPCDRLIDTGPVPVEEEGEEDDDVGRPSGKSTNHRMSSLSARASARV